MMVKILLVLLLIYFVLRLFTRYLLPYLLKRFIRNAEKKYSTGYGKSQAPQQREGETHINYVPNDYQQKENDLGEYVDFEDIDDINDKKE